MTSLSKNLQKAFSSQTDLNTSPTLIKISNISFCFRHENKIVDFYHILLIIRSLTTSLVFILNLIVYWHLWQNILYYYFISINNIFAVITFFLFLSNTNNFDRMTSKHHNIKSLYDGDFFSSKYSIILFSGGLWGTMKTHNHINNKSINFHLVANCRIWAKNKFLIALNDWVCKYDVWKFVFRLFFLDFGWFWGFFIIWLGWFSILMSEFWKIWIFLMSFWIFVNMRKFCLKKLGLKST